MEFPWTFFFISLQTTPLRTDFRMHNKSCGAVVNKKGITNKKIKKSVKKTLIYVLQLPVIHSSTQLTWFILIKKYEIILNGQINVHLKFKQKKIQWYCDDLYILYILYVVWCLILIIAQCQSKM